ncbi:MAG TPA: dihydroorotate dehydrogenase electron transfer subunit [Planctomycetes bacterium]|nr:dihydroorotate dehydrogenase electron transfer subunit [Planctomycetota bacterium]
MVRFGCPRIAAAIVPGQFVMIRLPECADPLLGRPFAMWDVVPDAEGSPWGLEVIYLVVGKMTSRLARMQPGSALEVWGPLGNGFPPAPTDHLVMVAGGIGQTPFLTLAKQYLGQARFGQPPRSVPIARRVTLCYGVRSQEYLAGVDDFRRLGVHVLVSTEDGSAGQRGLVTELVRPAVEATTLATRIACCGPEPMMAATARLARQLGLPCQVSLETPMACGVGICFSCVVRLRHSSGGWDYRRVCVEGPVFDAEQVDWEDQPSEPGEAEGGTSGRTRSRGGQR